MTENPKNAVILEPLRVLRSLNDEQFEQMIEEWQTYYKGKKYKRVERLGGAGDKGRDIRCTGNGLLEDLYIFQAKNYNKKLGKSDVFPDIAKCCYYTFNKDYNTPLEYKFVSPLGISPDLDKLFTTDRIQLKRELKENWDSMCASKIQKNNKILLEGDFLAYVEKFDFSIFGHVTPQELIDGVKETCYYSKYFGKLHKARPLAETPPEIAQAENVYVGKLKEVYEEVLGKNIENICELKKIDQKLSKDFSRHRECFYYAEVLRTFSRDVYPPDSQWFEGVKTEVYHAIIQDIEGDAANGFERLKTVMNRVVTLNIGLGNLATAIPILVQDRKGLCHHLANEREDVRWKK